MRSSEEGNAVRVRPPGRQRGQPLGRRCGQAGGQGRDRGSVTAEAAVAVPALVVFALALVWALMAASAQIRCVDAARAGARAAARSEPRAAALAAARAAAPGGARVTLGRAGDLWRVRVEAKAPGPGAMTLTLSAQAAAFAEDTVGEDGAEPDPEAGTAHDPTGLPVPSDGPSATSDPQTAGDSPDRPNGRAGHETRRASHETGHE